MAGGAGAIMAGMATTATIVGMITAGGNAIGIAGGIGAIGARRSFLRYEFEQQRRLTTG